MKFIIYQAYNIFRFVVPTESIPSLDKEPKECQTQTRAIEAKRQGKILDMLIKNYTVQGECFK